MSFQGTAGVAMFIVYHFVLFCRPGNENNLLFLNAKQNSCLTKNCWIRCGKTVGFRQHSNSNFVTPLHSTKTKVLKEYNTFQEKNVAMNWCTTIVSSSWWNMSVADPEGFRSQPELLAGKSDRQWKESSTSVFCTGVAVCWARSVDWSCPSDSDCQAPLLSLACVTAT